MQVWIDQQDLHKQLNQFLNKTGQDLLVNYAKGLGQELKKTPNVSVSLQGTDLDVTWSVMTNYNKSQANKFLDMKQYFARSPKARRTKDGGWYLIVPIGVKARTARANAPRSLWEQISHMDFGSTGSLGNQDTNYLQGLGRDQSKVISPLQYQWKSDNVTRLAPRSGKGSRGRYVSFRTVSDKSDPSSWLVNRQVFSQDNDQLTPDMQAQFTNMLQQKVQNYTTGNLNLL